MSLMLHEMLLNGSNKSSSAIVFSAGTTLHAYAWSSSGFGTKYASPAAVPGYVMGVDFSPDGKYVGVAHYAPPYVSIYPWDPITGFGTKVANPATPIPGTATSEAHRIAWSPDGTLLAIGMQGAAAASPFIHIYQWNNGFGTKFANPATPSQHEGNEVEFSPDGNFVAQASTGTQSANAWNVTATAFGAKVANPATDVATAQGVTFNPAGNVILFASATPRLEAYRWSAAGFGTKFGNPATAVPGTANSVRVSNDGMFVAVAHLSSPFLSVYNLTTTAFGAKVANPTVLPSGNGRGVAFSADDKYLAIAIDVTPCVEVYSWSGVFGTKFANPTVITTGGAGFSGVRFSPN